MSFFELLVVAVVGLIVIGPERLPETLRTGMLWLGRMKRMVNDTKQEFEQQLGVDEIRRELHNEQILQSLKAVEDAKTEVKEIINPMDQAIRDQIKDIENSIDDPVPHDDEPSDNEPSNDESAGSSSKPKHKNLDHEPPS